MTERPILFSAPMVRALLAGTKTQTRREVKPQTAILTDEMARAFGVQPPLGENSAVVRCPYGAVGDRLWVKETWFTAENLDGIKPTDLSSDVRINYAADLAEDDIILGRLRPSIFMRRWMSRITLELTAVRVERLNEISEADAIAEGVASEDHIRKPGDPYLPLVSPVEHYAKLWESLNGAGSWAANPWVWVLTFRRVNA